MAVGAMLVCCFASAASAAYEQVQTFNVDPGNTRLVGNYGIAINSTGAGGVAPGTVYTVDGTNPFNTGVSMFGPKGEVLGSWGAFTGVGVAVDQNTGNVYVVTNNPGEELGAVREFNATGSQLIASFGERGATHFPEPAESISEGPSKIHRLPTSANSIAVDDAGVVYLTDSDSLEALPPRKHRIMSFEPLTPGDYEHYVYSGQSADVSLAAEGHAPSVDAAGNLYVAEPEGIFMYGAGGSLSSPACGFPLAAGGILGMTVAPDSGEVFYFSEKNQQIHQLGPCNPTNEFVETATLTPAPKTKEIFALAFNPSLSYEPLRPPGALYGVDAHEREVVETESHPPRGHGLGLIFAPAEVRDPVVEAESVFSVTTSSGGLSARINPRGSPTRYVFQYLTEAEYQSNEVTDRFANSVEAPVGGAVVGSGQSGLEVKAVVSGLEADTDYRFRVVASSFCDPTAPQTLCSSSGPAQSFHTFPPLGSRPLETRAFELVSPASKAGNEVIPASGEASCRECKPAAAIRRFPMQSSPDGMTVVYEGFPFSASGGAVLENAYISRRTPAGWQTTTLSPLLQGSGSRQGYKAFDSDLTKGIVYQIDPTLSESAPTGYANLYTQTTGDPFSLTPLVQAPPPNRPVGEGFTLTFAGASSDFSHLLFEANDALTPQSSVAPAAVDGGLSKSNIYEAIGNQLALVNVLPGNTETVPGAVVGSGRLLAPEQSEDPVFSGAISADGERVFWTDPQSGNLYMRIGGEVSFEIPDPGSCAAALELSKRSCFLSASTDGSRVLMSNGLLFDTASLGSPPLDLSGGQGGFQGVVGASKGLTQIYFVDTEALTPIGDENANGEHAEPAMPNLYAWNEDSVSFIASLLPSDNSSGFEGGIAGDWKPSASDRSAQASSNGRYLAFISSASLTGYENEVSKGICPHSPAASGLCAEVFEYDAVDGALVCASCNPSGARPLGSSRLPLIQRAMGFLSQPSFLTDAGRIYFDSQDSLSPSDSNQGVEDVYQYEPNGTGGCNHLGGCVSMISAGRESADSNFLTADETGRNVFFTTRDQLVPSDRDELVDLYDAHEDAAPPIEPVPPSECAGDACQPPSTPPEAIAPGSLHVGEGGNVRGESKKHKKKHHRRRHRHHGKTKLHHNRQPIEKGGRR